MSNTNFYPASPSNVPDDLTAAAPSYKRQAWLAMLGLMGFLLIYVALLCGFALITYKSFMSFSSGNFDILGFIVFLCSGLLTIFMFKSLFAIRKMGTPDGLQVTRETQPELFTFLHSLADEIGAPKPHKVYLTPEVNAAVFYDLSLANLLLPSKKNLIIGLGLVNVLTLSELKAVLAHEFGHFAQNSMLVGRWVYIAQQIITHMVNVRDWFDNIIRFISGIDIRIAWIGWILSLILWSLRSLMDALLRIVIIAERALSREMEFNADLVAVSVTGSDALIDALYKLQAADQAWQTSIDVANGVAGQDNILEDLFSAQSETITEMQRILDDKNYGQPSKPDGNPSAHRVFEQENARPPQMWSTHPPSSDREDNAKATYIPAVNDDRSAWVLFADAAGIRRNISMSVYDEAKVKNLTKTSPEQAVKKHFSSVSYAPEYRGAYLGRSPVRGFASVSEILNLSNVSGAAINLEGLYPRTMSSDLKHVRNLEIERATLKALASGELKPSGGVIRHRGEEISKAKIPEAIEEIAGEKKTVLQKLMQHEADCRKTYLQIAEKYQNGWPEYLRTTLELLHASDHMQATVANEMALLVNTWNVITADGKIGYFEKKRILKVCLNLNGVMIEVYKSLGKLTLPEKVLKKLEIDDWAKVSPTFEFSKVDGDNWAEWCQAAFEVLPRFEHTLGLLHNIFLEELLESEQTLKRHHLAGTEPGPAPKSGKCISDYPVLLPGDEYVLQKKLDLWNRFVLAHGIGPSILRTAISLTIIGGTLYIGLAQ